MSAEADREPPPPPPPDSDATPGTSPAEEAGERAAADAEAPRAASATEDVGAGLNLLLRAAKKALAPGRLEELGRRAVHQVADPKRVEELGRRAVTELGDLGRKAAEQLDAKRLEELGRRAAQNLSPEKLEQLAEDAGRELLGAVGRVAGRVDDLVSPRAAAEPREGATEPPAPGASTPGEEAPPAASERDDDAAPKRWRVDEE